MTLIYKINDLESKIPYTQWEALKKEFVEFAKDKKQIETNWNELKKWLEDTLENEKYCHLAEKPEDRCRYNVFKEVLSKIQELERGKE